MAGRLKNAKNLSLRQIEAFHVVVQTRSITSASEVLSISQPSLSRTIKRLEDVLELRLFDRDHRGLVPTSEALSIFQEVDPIVKQIAGLSHRISEIATGEFSEFRLGATASVSRALVPRALKLISKNKSGPDLFFDVLSVDQMEDYLLTGQGECLVTISPVEHPMFQKRLLGNCELVAVVPMGHPLSTKERLDTGDFDGVDIIHFQHEGPHQRVIDGFLQNRSREARKSAVVRFSDTAIALANQEMGVALVDEFSAWGPLGDRVIRLPIQNAPTFSAFLQWNGRKPQSQFVQVLGDKIEELIKKPNTPRKDMPSGHD
ncbi:LysR family transcriptional regulator [Gymnodinialimonas sp. 2305UL16-5]|uniref:LysR family transcriptional regulator n=1 Tax=Gymnodinialimonas mytili TaxID=3126503 RepID=UPI0030AE29E3